MSRKIDPRIYVPFADKGWSNRKIGRHFGIDESVVRRGLTSIQYQRHLVPEYDEEGLFRIELDTPIVHSGDLMLTADWHIPLYDPSYVNEMIRTAREQNLKTLCVAGDFFNFDALSQYDPKQLDAGLERELNEGLAVMRVLLETFDTIYYLWGNHDARLHRALGFAIQFREAMKLVFGILGTEVLDRVVFTNLDHMWVETPRGDWYVCHPKNYTAIPLNTARRLASKFNANIITAHSHHCAVGYGPDGQKVVAEIGGLFDKAKTAYLQRTTTFPTWQQGYSYLKDGLLHVLSPGWELSAGVNL